MASQDDVETAVRRGLSDAPVVGDIIKGFLGPSVAERKARADEQKARDIATDTLGFNKGVYNTNQRTVQNTIDKLFGRSGGSSAESSSEGAPTAAAAAAPAERSIANGGLVPNTAAGYDSAGNFQGGNFDPSQPAYIPNPNWTPPPSAGGAAPAAAASNASDDAGSEGFYTGGLAGAEADDLANLDKYLSDVGNLTPAQISDALKDIESQVKISQDTRDAQKFSLDSLKGLTNPQETAQEKLIREMARRTMEGQMKGDREAMAQSLKARGVYGSGAELAKQLSTQQQLADERQLSELGANAQASKRAMDALGKYTDLGVQLGKQDIAVGSALDKAAEFNNAIKEQHNQFVTKSQRDQEALDADIAGKKAMARGDVTRNKRNDLGNVANLLTSLTGLQTGTATSGAKLVNDASSNLGGIYKGDAAVHRANDNSDEGFGPISI